MNTIKTILFKRFHILFPLFALTTLSIFLLSIRLKITHSFFYLFLVWNLFLAMVPYIISSYLISLKRINKPFVGVLLIAWLLFLPNAPYLCTDLIHLRLSPLNWIVYDGIMITVFSITGLAFYLFSVKEVSVFLFEQFNKNVVVVFLSLLPFLVGFGIYLGRVLRWNSWDIIHQPYTLAIDIISIFTSPIENRDVWVFTLLFGIFLKSCLWLFKKNSFGS